MTQRKMLNLGCGRVILPAPRPVHYGLIDPITEYALWHNVDKVALEGVDEVYNADYLPFPWDDDSFDGALLGHFAEHIKHEIKLREYGSTGAPYSHVEALDEPTWGVSTGGFPAPPSDDERKHAARMDRLANLQDGWYATFAELHRVCTPGSIIHVLSPYAWSQGAVTDPTHTRYLTEHTFTHSMQPDPNSPFRYATGGLNLELVEPARFGITPMFAHLLDNQQELQYALQTRINVAYELYVKLRVVK